MARSKIQNAIDNERYEDAIRMFSALESPKQSDCIAVSIAYEAAGDHQAAYDRLKEAYAQKPYVNMLATMLARVAEEIDADEAIKWYGEAIKRGEAEGNAKNRIEEIKQRPRASLTFFEAEETFDNLIGMKEVKEQLRENIIYPVKYPDIYKKHSKKIGTGYIFYGPPGTGKTYLAKCLAGECRRSSGKEIRMAVVRISKVLDMYVGNSEKNVSKIFEEARKNSPCILFFDEFDALGKTRSSNSDTASDSGTMSKVVDEFLTELDGIEKKNEQLFIIAATNRPWEIDDSLKRPGRLSNAIYVRPPNHQERIDLFKLYTKGKQLGSIQWDRLARATMGYSQSDIAELADSIALSPIRKEIKNLESGASPRQRHERITMTAFLMLILKSKSSIESWYVSMKKELVGVPKVEIINGKKYTNYTQGRLQAQEKKLYKDLIEDIRKNTTIDYQIEKGVMRSIALYLF